MIKKYTKTYCRNKNDIRDQLLTEILSKNKEVKLNDLIDISRLKKSEIKEIQKILDNINKHSNMYRENVDKILNLYKENKYLIDKRTNLSESIIIDIFNPLGVEFTDFSTYDGHNIKAYKFEMFKNNMERLRTEKTFNFVSDICDLTDKFMHNISYVFNNVTRFDNLATEYDNTSIFRKYMDIELNDNEEDENFVKF